MGGTGQAVRDQRHRPQRGRVEGAHQAARGEVLRPPAQGHTQVGGYKKQKIQQPWFTKGLKQSSMTKDHLFRLARKKKDNK